MFCTDKCLNKANEIQVLLSNSLLLQQNLAKTEIFSFFQGTAHSRFVLNLRKCLSCVGARLTKPWANLHQFLFVLGCVLLMEKVKADNKVFTILLCVIYLKKGALSTLMASMFVFEAQRLNTVRQRGFAEVDCFP